MQTAAQWRRELEARTSGDGWPDTVRFRTRRERLVERYEREGRTESRHVDEAVAELQALFPDSVWSPVEVDHNAASLPRDPTAEAILLKKIQWWVEHTRFLVWGTFDPPYDDLDEGREWLEGVWEHRRRRVPLSGDEVLSEMAEIGEVMERLEEWGLMLVETPSERMFCWLPHGKRVSTTRTVDRESEERSSLAVRLRTGAVREIELGKGPSPYQRLARELREMSEATGFAKADLLDLLLTGRAPRLQAAIVERRFHRVLGPDEQTQGHTYLTVRVNSRLTNEDLKQLGAKLRPLWRPATTDVRQGLVKERELITQVVEALGGPPPEEKRQKYDPGFWGKVRQRINEVPSFRGSTEPLALARRFYRARGNYPRKHRGQVRRS